MCFLWNNRPDRWPACSPKGAGSRHLPPLAASASSHMGNAAYAEECPRYPAELLPHRGGALSVFPFYWGSSAAPVFGRRPQADGFCGRTDRAVPAAVGFSRFPWIASVCFPPSPASVSFAMPAALGEEKRAGPAREPALLAGCISRLFHHRSDFLGEVVAALLKALAALVADKALMVMVPPSSLPTFSTYFATEMSGSLTNGWSSRQTSL